MELLENSCGTVGVVRDYLNNLSQSLIIFFPKTSVSSFTEILFFKKIVEFKSKRQSQN